MYTFYFMNMGVNDQFMPYRVIRQSYLLNVYAMEYNNTISLVWLKASLLQGVLVQVKLSTYFIRAWWEAYLHH